MGKISQFLDIMMRLLMLTSVNVVDSVLDKEAADEVHFPKLAPYRYNLLYLPSDDNFFENYQSAGAELMDLKKSKKSFASFRIRPKG